MGRIVHLAKMPRHIAQHRVDKALELALFGGGDQLDAFVHRCTHGDAFEKHQLAHADAQYITDIAVQPLALREMRQDIVDAQQVLQRCVDKRRREPPLLRVQPF